MARSLGGSEADPRQHLPMVLAVIEMRRVRSYLMPGAWFSDPPWDLLIELYRRRLSGSTSAAAPEDIGLAPSVVRRWITLLAEAGMIARNGDTLSLTAAGVEVMSECVGHLCAVPTPASKDTLGRAHLPRV